MLYQITGPQYDTLPFWLGEGLATLAESAPNPAYAVVLETAVANQAIIPFDQLCLSFPDSETDALLAYAQSLFVDPVHPGQLWQSHAARDGFGCG